MTYKNSDDRKYINKENIKKVVIILVVFAVVFLIVRACNNALTDTIREDINKETTITATKQEKEKIDLNKPFNYYNIETNEKLQDLITRVILFVKPKKLQKFIDVSTFSIRHDWNKYNRIYDYFNTLLDIAYQNLLRQLLRNKVNYDEAPLTEHFKEKFKDGYLGEYSYLCKVGGWTSYDFEKKYFVLSEYKGESQDDYYFNFSLDDEGNLDDIVLEHIEQIYDEHGVYIAKKDSKLMNKEKDIKLILSQILLSEDQYVFEGDAGYDYRKDPQSRYNRFKEFGLTDRFREYYASLNGKGFIDDIISDSDTITIENIDIKNKNAKVKLGFWKSKENKYYDITWEVDDMYRLDTVEVKPTLNHEEKK